MIVIQFRKNLLHDSLAEKDSLGPDAELLAIIAYGSHLTVIQIDDLPMTPYQGLLLLLKIFRVNARNIIFLPFSHLTQIKLNSRQS